MAGHWRGRTDPHRGGLKVHPFTFLARLPSSRVLNRNNRAFAYLFRDLRMEQPMIDPIKRRALLRREFEVVLKDLGASKSERVAAATALRPETIERLLPLWRRIKLRVSE